MYLDQQWFIVQANDGEEDGDMELSAKMFEAALRQQVLLPQRGLDCCHWSYNVVRVGACFNLL
jgi:hypothetical protein